VRHLGDITKINGAEIEPVWVITGGELMKAVLISIRPEWCAKIASCEKKIEVRKSCPRLETPFKVYIYCTKDVRKQFWTGPRYSYVDDHSHNAFDKCGNGKVIGEFLCDQIIEDHTFGHDEKFYSAACMSACDAAAYAMESPMYGWHISNLKIYDVPRELISFVKPLVLEKIQPYTWYVNKERYLTRAPQSWCYVEDAE
jgi:hypothetical protein